MERHVAFHRRRLVAWRNAVFTLFTLSGFAVATWVSRLPAVQGALGLDALHLGLLILGLTIGCVIGISLAPPIVHLAGSRNGIRLMILLIVIGLSVVGIASTVWTAVPLVTIGLAALGFGNGAVDVMINVQGAAVEKAATSSLLPLMHAFFSLGMVLGAGGGALSSAIGIPVAAQYSAAAVVILLTAFSVVGLLPSATQPDGEHAGESKESVIRRLRADIAIWADARLLLIGVVALGMSFAEGSASDWLAVAAVHGHRRSETAGAVAFWVFTAAMTASRVLGVPVLDRFGRVPVVRTGAAMASFGIVLFVVTPLSALQFVGIALWGLGCALGFPIGVSAAADIGDHDQAAARVSAVSMMGYVAFLAGPPLIGFLASRVGILGALVPVAVLVAVSGVMAFAVRERRARPGTGLESMPGRDSI